MPVVFWTTNLRQLSKITSAGAKLLPLSLMVLPQVICLFKVSPFQIRVLDCSLCRLMGHWPQLRCQHILAQPALMLRGQVPTLFLVCVLCMPLQGDHESLPPEALESQLWTADQVRVLRVRRDRMGQRSVFPHTAAARSCDKHGTQHSSLARAGSFTPRSAGGWCWFVGGVRCAGGGACVAVSGFCAYSSNCCCCRGTFVPLFQVQVANSETVAVITA